MTNVNGIYSQVWGQGLLDTIQWALNADTFHDEPPLALEMLKNGEIGAWERWPDIYPPLPWMRSHPEGRSVGLCVATHDTSQVAVEVESPGDADDDPGSLLPHLDPLYFPPGRYRLNSELVMPDPDETD